MPPKILTQTSLDAVRPASNRQELHDGKVNALRLIVQPTGKMSWAVRYSVQGRDRRLTLGPYPGIGLAEARKRALAAIGDIASGNDPAAAKAARKESARQARDARPADAELVESVAAEFIERYARPNLRTWPELQRKFDRDVIPIWGGRRLADIGKADVHRLLDHIRDRGSPVSANRTFAAVRRLCRWAVERDIITVSPTEGISRPTKEKARDRKLSLDELALVWRASYAITQTYGAVVRALILTAQRRDEVGGMCWRELDRVNGLWTIPSDRVKNKREHVVVLSPQMLALIGEQRRVSDLVFSVGKTPAAWSRAKKALDAAVAKLNDGQPLKPWVIHDLRRSAASGMARLRVPPHVVEKILNHTAETFGGVAGVYNQYDYADEARDALNRWAAEIEQAAGQGVC